MMQNATITMHNLSRLPRSARSARSQPRSYNKDIVWHKVLDSFMYAFIITMGYILMLIGMSYDLRLMFSIAAGIMVRQRT